MLASDPLHDEVLAAHRRAAATMGLVTPPLHADGRVANAESNGVQVRYNPTWLRWTLRPLAGAARHAAILFIFTHELAHHARQDARIWPRHAGYEHRADRVAGAVLRALGVARSSVARAMSIVGTECSRNHGCPEDRLRAVLWGYDFGA